MRAKIEKQKEDMELQDIYHWQLCQYLIPAFKDAYAACWGKNSNSYPKKPMFSRKLIEDDNIELTEKQKELETIKFKDFFSNLGNYVKIKDKGGI